MSVRTRNIALLAVIVGVTGCEAANEGAVADSGLAYDVGVPPGEVTFTLVITAGVLPESADQIGPLRLVAEPVDGGPRTVVDLAGPVERWPVRVPVAALRAGRYRLTVFLDRDGSSTFDECPFPPTPGDTEIADTLDNINGVAVAEVIDGGEVEVQLDRRICGPGDPTTGVRGEIELPEGQAEVPSPIFLLLEPLDDLRPAEPQALSQTTDDAGTPRSVPLRIPLFPKGLTRAAPFDIGELVPGRYHAVFFADADGDHSPTPCTDGVGGGDRYLAELPGELVIEAGARTELADSVQLAAAAGCTETLIGVTGELDLAPALVAALQGEAPPPVDGAVRLALLDPAAGTAVIESALLLADLAARPLPHHFTLTGLPEGEWRVAVFVDADGDGQFAPCGALLGGPDRIYAVRDGVRVRPGPYADLGRVELGLPDECADLDTGVRGRISVELEEGPVGSGRPIRLDLIPADEAGERRSFLLFENHGALHGDTGEDNGGTTPFAVVGDLPPGTYSARVYLDTDRDGAYLSCADDPFGDRASSRELRVELVAGVMLDLGEVQVASRGCAVPAVSAELTIELSEDASDRADRGELRVAIREQGGWRSDPLLTTLPLPGGVRGPWTAPPIALAPGEYRATAYVDTNENQALDECDQEYPDALAGEAVITLDAQTPIARATLEIRTACPP